MALKDKLVNLEDLKVVQDEVVTKAEQDGSYQSMTVGNAEQLVATVGIEDKVPYNFRTSGGTADIGDREVDKIVGGTVAWNQLANNLRQSGTINGLTFTNNNNKTLTMTGEASETNNYTIVSSLNLPANHVIAAFAGAPRTASYGIYINDFPPMGKDGVIVKKSSTLSNITLRVKSASDGGADVGTVTLTPQVFDLTQMFGTTIADYIYGLETATPGAGVAWFRKLFPKDYYAYDAGSLQSVQAKSHEMVGFNAWDEESEDGYYDTLNNGAKASSSLWKRCKNLIPCVPETNYYFYCDYSGSGSFGALIYYDASGNMISYKATDVKNQVSETPAGCHFMAFYAKTAWFNSNFCINLSWDGERDGEYEPYDKHSYPLDDSLTLRGIPKLDANNSLYYDGDTYESDGTVTRKFGVHTIEASELSISSLDSSYSNMTPVVLAEISGMKKTSTKLAVHEKYGIAVGGYPFDSASNVGKLMNDPSLSVYWFGFAKGTTLDQAKSQLVGTKIIYELATPTTETAETYQNPQVVNDFGTEEYVDAGVTASTPTRDVAIPVGHETTYQANLRAKLEMSPDSPDGSGDYIVRQTNGENEYVPLSSSEIIAGLQAKLPTPPSEDGTYKLTVTVASGTATYTWEA